MKLGSIVIALAALAVIAAQPAEARKKHHAKRHVTHLTQQQCRDTPQQFSWSFLWDLDRAPHWNGCSPAVYDGRRFTGQDPDIHVRLKLQRDPSEGYYDDKN